VTPKGLTITNSYRPLEHVFHPQISQIYTDFQKSGKWGFVRFRNLRKSANGVGGISDIEGKAAMGSGERSGKLSEFQSADKLYVLKRFFPDEES